MREFDPKVLAILKTETAMEKLLRSDPEERARFAQKVYEGGRDERIAHELKNNVSITRLLRFTPSLPRRCSEIEMLYIISGTVHMHVGTQALVLRKGDFFLPNQYTVESWDPLGEDDIAVCFVMKPRFLEDACVKLTSNTVLSRFMLDTLRRDISWNQFLHFTGIEDIAVHNLAETLVYGAFPYLDDTNIACGSSPDPVLTGDLMCALFTSLSRNLSALTENSPSNYQEILRQTICDYIGREYQTATLQELAVLVHQSESALSRQIKEIFGYNFKDLLLQKRFERAVVLLEQTDLPIADIAQAVGYENTSFFYRRFRQIYGISPKEYRNRRT